MTMSVQGFAPMPARARPRINAGHPRLAKTAKFVSWDACGTKTTEKMLAALVLLVSSAALPLRAPARGLGLRTCNKPWRGCPEEGGSRLGEKLAGFSEAMAMYDGSTSDKSCSTSAPAGENGLDRAASKGVATSVAARNTLLQLYKTPGRPASTPTRSTRRL